MIQLIDSHCHIHLKEYENENIGSELKEANDAGVVGMLAVSTDYMNSKESIAFAAEHKNVWPVVGIHPHEAKKSLETDELQLFCDLVTMHAEELVGIGECGLDYFYDHSPRQAQINVLESQLELAVKYDLPVSFHVRSAFDDFWPVFENFSGLRGVLHSFTDSPQNLEKAIESGLYVGVNGIITFSRDDKWKCAVAAAPLNRILLETDAPYLTPKPYRGKINKLKYIRLVAEELANIRGISLQEVANTTKTNTQELFKIQTNA